MYTIYTIYILDTILLLLCICIYARISMYTILYLCDDNYIQKAPHVLNRIEVWRSGQLSVQMDAWDLPFAHVSTVSLLDSAREAQASFYSMNTSHTG